MTQWRLRDADVHWREIDGEVIALETRSSTYVASNAAGALLWSELAKGATSERLADVLVEAYGIDPARSAADVERFLAELSARNMISA